MHLCTCGKYVVRMWQVRCANAASTLCACGKYIVRMWLCESKLCTCGKYIVMCMEVLPPLVIAVLRLGYYWILSDALIQVHKSA